jgi:hypothetical protein
MARNKVISLILTVVIVLTIAVAPLAAFEAAQPGLFAHAVQGGSKLFSIGVAAPAVPGFLACEGCSAGGGGPD